MLSCCSRRKPSISIQGDRKEMSNLSVVMSSVFLLGATGYIGGSLLIQLRKSHPGAKITALVRSPADLPVICEVGAIPLEGTFSDYDKIAECASHADMVVNAGSSDNKDMILAVLRGLKGRKEAGRDIGIFIHVSGSSVFLDDAEGWFDPEGRVWNDSNEEDIKSIGDSVVHGPVDVAILKAGEDGYVYTYIMCPALVYGVGSGPVAKDTNFYRNLLKASVQSGVATYVGEGSNVNGSVHISDFVLLFGLISELSLAGPPNNSAYARYFFATSGKFAAKPLVSQIARLFYEKGFTISPEPQSVTFEEAKGKNYMRAGNTRMQADRSFALSWKPVQPTCFDTLETDIESVSKTISKASPLQECKP
ncbi:NAD(P)-binding protein [Rickenella mellea]|uniref:NAD(P)-binding protein n=1 Tax=Rickenella mellea TaxID=50990 RepID=A0A4Y7PPX1_9AGAM|nr:NAD(P)-binding protein [Rickenella mellea]